MSELMRKAEVALHQYFGFEHFRPRQDAIIRAVSEGQDVMCIMPTGGGKSLCYQLPALIREGTAIVVSPLIALMKDQLDALEERGIAATLINSTLDAKEQGARIRSMVEGAYKMVYIAPERFRHPYFIDQLKRVPISFVAVDEAHCVSQWGHDFRPDYLRIGSSLSALGSPQVCAFTATATPEVRADIANALSLKEPQIFVTGFTRANLEFRVTEVAKRADKWKRLSALIEQEKTGIIYCATRKRVDEVSEQLEAWDVPFVAYHGGMDDRTREEQQNRFIRREVDVAVATNAFGMGIDRADIRFVAHFEIPGSVEAYYQEAGRAGRDGLPGVCEVFFNYADRNTQDFFIDGSNPTVGLIRSLYALLRERADPDGEVKMSIDQMTEALQIRNSMQVSTALKVLQQMNVVERFDLEGERIRGTRVTDLSKPAHLLEFDEAALMEKERRDRAKLESMIAYSNAFSCRQAWIRDFFGEKDPEPCENCDVCRSQTVEHGMEISGARLVTLQKLLSGVARMSRRSGRGWEPVYGRGLVVQMLIGSASERIRQMRLDQLTTHGILQREGAEFVRLLMEECLRRGLLVTTGGMRPLVTLTPMGDAVMRAKQKIRLIWPPTSAVAGTSGGSRVAGGKTLRMNSGDIDDSLLDALKKKRLQLARIRGNVPPYHIFSNRVLEFLASERPGTIEEAMAIPGIGEVKARKVLPPFLEIIVNWKDK